jgi:hypothetical protein
MQDIKGQSGKYYVMQGIQGITGEYMGIQGNTREWREIQ